MQQPLHVNGVYGVSLTPEEMPPGLADKVLHFHAHFAQMTGKGFRDAPSGKHNKGRKHTKTRVERLARTAFEKES